MTRIDTQATGLARALWGGMPLPVGAELVGVLYRGEAPHSALLQVTRTGIYVSGAGGVVQGLDQREVRDALGAHEAATTLGRRGGEAGIGASKLRATSGRLARTAGLVRQAYRWRGGSESLQAALARELAESILIHQALPGEDGEPTEGWGLPASAQALTTADRQALSRACWDVALRRAR